MIKSAGLKHQGRHRPHNQDHLLIREDLGLYAVADGVEAEPSGEVASRLALESLAEIIGSINLESDATPPFEYAQQIPLEARALKFAVREVNRRLLEKAGSDPRLTGMCTTLTALWLQGPRALIANVGDSRAYLIRGGRILQLTSDHTTLAQGDAQAPAVAEFLEQYTTVSEHELTRAIGINPDLEVQLAAGTPRREDLFLLCTDGLYQDLRDFEIMDLACAYPPETATRKLISLANEKGGKDNLAVVIVKFS